MLSLVFSSLPRVSVVFPLSFFPLCKNIITELYHLYRFLLSSSHHPFCISLFLSSFLLFSLLLYNKKHRCRTLPSSSFPTSCLCSSIFSNCLSLCVRKETFVENNRPYLFPHLSCPSPFSLLYFFFLSFFPCNKR